MRLLTEDFIWADGLPLIDPAPDLLLPMMAHSGLQPEEELGPIPPSFALIRREHIGETAVMAGCEPEFLPVVEAAIRACLEPDFNLLGIQTTTEPATPLIVVNGPIRLRLGMNTASNVFGNGNRVNACIGRAVRLVMTRHGHAIPGQTDMATFGHPGKYTYCIGENEEQSPWKPFSEDRNYSRQDSVVTVIGCDTPINVGYADNRSTDLLDLIAHTMAIPGSNNAYVGGEIVVILSPQHATMLAAAGWSKEHIQRYLFEQARLDATRVPPDVWDKIRDLRDKLLADYSSIPVVDDPDGVLLVVAGGLGSHSCVIPTFGSTRASSAKIAEALNGCVNNSREPG